MKAGAVKVAAAVQPANLKTLDEWAKDFGASDPEVEEELFTTIEVSALRDLGRRADSEVLIEETPGFLASVVETERKLTAKQRTVLVGYSPMWLPVLANEGVALRGLYARFVEQDAEAMRELARRRAAASEAWTACIAIRDQGASHLRRVTTAGKDDRSFVDESVGNARTALSLATGTRSVATAITELLAQTDSSGKPTVLARALRRMAIDETFVKALNDAAELVLTTDAEANATAANIVTQDQLDTRDGRLMRVTEWTWRAFRQANKRDPSIGVPLLGKMEPLFVTKRGAKSTEEDAPTSPAPPTPVTPPVG